MIYFPAICNTPRIARPSTIQVRCQGWVTIITTHFYCHHCATSCVRTRISDTHYLDKYLPPNILAPTVRSERFCTPAGASSFMRTICIFHHHKLAAVPTTLSIVRAENARLCLVGGREYWILSGADLESPLVATSLLALFPPFSHTRLRPSWSHSRVPGTCWRGSEISPCNSILQSSVGTRGCTLGSNRASLLSQRSQVICASFGTRSASFDGLLLSFWRNLLFQLVYLP